MAEKSLSVIKKLLSRVKIQSGFDFSKEHFEYAFKKSESETFYEIVFENFI